MTIPIHSTTITILRSPLSATRDQWDENPAPDAAPVATGVRAVIWQPQGGEQQSGSTQERRQPRLSADPCDLDHRDVVLDEKTGDVWQVLWTQRVGAFGLEETIAGLASTSGVTT